MLTDDEIRALLEGCGGVTPGPWTVEMHGPSPVLYSGRSNERHGLNLLRLSDGDWNFNNNAAHIARCDPDTIRELCTRVLEAEAALDQAEIVGGLTANGNLWRFWSQKAMDYIAYCNKERDEARARADGLERLVKLYGLLDDGSSIERAEAEGYWRGVEDAFRAANKCAGLPLALRRILDLLEKEKAP